MSEIENNEDSSITWKVASGILGMVLLGMFGYFGAALWATAMDDHGRILLLEKQAVLNRNDIDRTMGVLDRLNLTLQQITYEHRQILDAEEKQRRR